MVYTIDYLDNIVINANEPCTKNNHAISYLQEGLIMLAKNVYIIEKQKLNTLQGECVLELTFNSEENRRLACFFHWFSVSLVSYIKLIALMDIMQINHWEFNDLKKNKKELKKHVIKYTEKIIPEVFHWRNKIAAHLSAVDPYMEDNSAMLEVSLMNPISWSNPHYYASAFNWSNMEGSSNLKQWSVVEIFDRLKPRYWPEIELK